jgi:hypothetical protein
MVIAPRAKNAPAVIAETDEARGEVALTPVVVDVPVYSEETAHSTDPSQGENFVLVSVDQE